MEYNTTAENSSQNMYPTAYLSNSNRTPSFQSTVELNVSLSPQILIHVQQWLKKQSSDTRCRSIFHAKHISRTYRNQSMSSLQTDVACYVDVFTSCIGAISVLTSSWHAKTSAGVTNNQTWRILLRAYLLHYDIMYVIESEYR